MRRSALRVATWEETLAYGGHEGLRERGLLPPVGGGAGYALVGTAGAATLAGGSVTPIWPVSEARTAGNLLVCWAVNVSGTTVPTTPTPGWSTAVSQAAALSAGSAALFYTIAVGADAAPTVKTTTGTVVASVAEFSGNASVPLDQAQGATSPTSPATATNPGADTASGELLLYVSASVKSGASNTNTLTNALTNATRTDVVNVGATSATEHHAWGFGITTAHAVADADAFSVATTTNITNMVAAIASFKLAAATLLPGQARSRHLGARSHSPARGRF